MIYPLWCIKYEIKHDIRIYFMFRISQFFSYKTFHGSPLIFPCFIIHDVMTAGLHHLVPLYHFHFLHGHSKGISHFYILEGFFSKRRGSNTVQLYFTGYLFYSFFGGVNVECVLSEKYSFFFWKSYLNIL